MNQRNSFDRPVEAAPPSGDVEIPRTELQGFLLMIRPHVIGILKAIDKVCGTGRSCPHCGRRLDQSGSSHVH